MPWDEFCDLLAGLDDTTPLGKMVSIRLETDEEIINAFTPDQKRIHDDWQKKQVMQTDISVRDSLVKEFQAEFASAEGVGLL